MCMPLFCFVVFLTDLNTLKVKSEVLVVEKRTRNFSHSDSLVKR